MAAKPTRVLFVAPPAYGHLFPLVPLAWALRAAGHEVLVATCGISMNGAIRAGLPAVDVARGVDLPGLLRRHKSDFGRAFPPVPDVPSANGAASVFTELCDAMADGTVDAARSWRPDLIVYTPEAAAALVAATRLDVPAVFVSIGLGHTPALMADRYATMAATCERHGIAAFHPPCAWIDLSPPSFREPGTDGWPMRYVQYNGGQQAPIQSPAPNGTRVAVTLGTMVPLVFGVSALQAIVAAARSIDATFVIAHGSDSPRDLGPLPSNVHAHAWLALDSLVASCDAAIHHGGFGTTLAVVAAGLPQLILPHGADQFYNADVLRRRGAALTAADGELVEAIRLLLGDDTLRGAAQDVAAEIASMPPPSELVPRLVGVVH